MAKIVAKYWGHENDPEGSEWHIVYTGKTLADCWKQIMRDGHSSDDWKFEEEG